MGMLLLKEKEARDLSSDLRNGEARSLGGSP
jgi:hypothetical protein